MSAIVRAQAIIRSVTQDFEHYELPSSTNISSVSTQSELTSVTNPPRKIFVVHGHGNEMKQSVSRFIENLDFKAIVLHEQASGGETIVEKLERNSDVSSAIVLLSPDDIGAAKGNKDGLKPRARQNVVL